MKFDISKQKKIALSAMITIALTGCGSDSDETGESTSKDLAAAEGWSSTTLKSNMNAVDSDKIAVYDVSSGSNETVSNMSEVIGDWHFSYQKSRGFHTNGGDNGDGNALGNVEGCIAYEYESLYDEEGNPIFNEFDGMTASNTLSRFEHLDFDACDNFTTDRTTNSKIIGNEWYAFSGHSISVPEGATGWIFKSDGNDPENPTYARITPKEYDGGFIFTVEQWDSSLQEGAGDWATAVDSPVMEYYSGYGNAYFDFDSNSAFATETAGWDFYILKNPGHLPEIIMADGVGVGEYYDSSDEDAFEYTSVDQLDHPTQPTVGAGLYKWRDNTTTGAMEGPGYFGGLELSGYSYIPNYTVYLLKEGDTYYKVQFLGYKGEDGEAENGTIVLRYASKTVEELPVEVVE